MSQAGSSEALQSKENEGESSQGTKPAYCCRRLNQG